MKKKFELFPEIFLIFEVCSIGNLVDFLDACSSGDLEGISERNGKKIRKKKINEKKENKNKRHKKRKRKKAKKCEKQKTGILF